MKMLNQGALTRLSRLNQQARPESMAPPARSGNDSDRPLSEAVTGRDDGSGQARVDPAASDRSAWPVSWSAFLTDRVDDPPTGDTEQDLSALPTGSEIENRAGRHWLRSRQVTEIWSDGANWLSSSMANGPAVRASKTDRPPDQAAFLAAFPDRVVYLDLETCGFAGSMVFLIGLVEWRDEAFCLSQLLARHYGEEKAVLQTLWERLAGKCVLVTFNGKSFDWPMVQDRSILHRLASESRSLATDGLSPCQAAVDSAGPWALSAPLVHYDVLHHARRRWKDRLPDCKLQTLERYVCRRRRGGGDIAGREIPAAYHDFVRSGDAWLLRCVLHHNALDLITLLQLSLRICDSPGGMASSDMKRVIC
jgi:uncharacterized protein YprB with RNaseH-like and TPR domain